jgi:glycosyltransferase involved in cell wall biosynthesis
MARSMHHNGAEMHLLAMNTVKHFSDPVIAAVNLPHYKEMETVTLDNRVKFFPLVYSLIHNRSYHIQRFESRDFNAALINFLNRENFDFIQLESLYLCPYIPIIKKYSKAKIILRAHNVEYQIWKRLASGEKNIFKRAYLEIAWRQLKKYEFSQLKAIDILLPITQEDGSAFLSNSFTGHIYYFPIGINCVELKYQKPVFSKVPVLHFIGSLDWLPNQEGVIWFVQKIWPRVLVHFPDAKLRIAGRKIPLHIFDLQSDSIEVVGEVKDAAAFVQSAPIAIVPLLSGGGMRAKIIEAMALGALVLSTSVGIEGIPAKHHKEAYIADSADAFVSALQTIYANPMNALQITMSARALIEQQFDVHQLASDYIDFLRNT